MKILDFGLAKRGAESAADTASAGLSGVTRTMSLTAKGAIVGSSLICYVAGTGGRLGGRRPQRHLFPGRGVV